jgi:hypothetical protein
MSHILCRRLVLVSNSLRSPLRLAENRDTDQPLISIAVDCPSGQPLYGLWSKSQRDFGLRLGFVGRRFFSSAGSARMSTNDSTVNEQVLKVRVSGTKLVQLLEDTNLSPASKTSVDGVPIAVVFRQQSPLRA